MKDKKKGFWILLLIFSLLAVALLSVNQLTMDSSAMGDMDLSMGGMMKKHHINKLNAVDLLRSSFEPHGMATMDGHHPLNQLMNSMSFVTTIIVYLALPLLLGGATFLLVLWY